MGAGHHGPTRRVVNDTDGHAAIQPRNPSMIICCGEALIDMIPAPTTGGPDGFVPHAGGAVFNSAIALGRLGVDTHMLTGLSTDMFGTQLRETLGASHVGSDLSVMSDRPTTLAFVKLSDGHAQYSFFDENSAGRMLSPADMPARVPDTAAALFFGGISLACEPCADAYATVLNAHAGDHVIMIDPNIRPGFIADAKTYLTRLNGLIAQADIVKVSDEDLGWILPDVEGLAEQARALCERGPRFVIVTQGSAGARAFDTSGEVAFAASDRVEVADTVGAGDTFNAGVLAHLSRAGKLDKSAIAALTPEDIRAAMAFGNQVAAVTVSRAGANPPWQSEL
jgi:fructokinase